MHPSYLVLVSIVMTAGICLFNVASYSESVYETRRHVPRQCTLARTTTDSPQERYAVVTLLTTSGYVGQAEVLGKSLLIYSHLPCTIEKIALITQGSDLTREDHYRLSEVGWNVKMIPTISYPSRVNSHTVKHLRYLPLLTKLCVFNMTDYSALLFMDADTIAIGDIHGLFTKDLPAMRERGMQLGWTRDQGRRSRARTFSVGLMLVIPSHGTFSRLMAFLRDGEFDASLPEQGLMNSFFGVSQYEINPKFNAMTSIPLENATLYQEIKDDIRVFHSSYFKPTQSFYLVRCYWHGTQDFCREWQAISRLKIRVYGRHDLSEAEPMDR